MAESQSNQQQPPEWASFFTDKQHRRFVAEVEDYFRRRGLEAEVSGGVVRLVDRSWEGPADLGLLNLAQGCNLSKPEDWRTLIAQHFDIMQGAVAQQERAVAFESLDDVYDLLAVRIWPREAGESLGLENLVWREDLPGTLTTLVLDLPTSIRTLRPEEARRWSHSLDQLMSIGLGNILSGETPQRVEESVEEGGRIVALTGRSFFVATHALALEEHEDMLGAHGTVVVVPHRHAMIAAPIDDVSIVAALVRMIPAALEMYREGPGSITAHLYWYREGGFVDLPYSMEDQQINFTPPPEFAEMLERLQDE